jgi:hypothetical protein
MPVFRDILQTAQQHTKSTLAIGIAPVLSKLPHEIQRFDDPLLPFGKAIIDASADLVCAYVFHLGAYLGLGAAGAIALERTLAYVPSPIVRILHGPFASAEYVRAAFEDAFSAHAVTLSTHVSPATISAYTKEPQHGVFIKAPTDSDFERHLVAEEKHNGQIGLYRYTAPGGTMELLAEPSLEIDWQVDPIIYASQDSNFRDEIRAAAERIHARPHKGLWSS